MEEVEGLAQCWVHSRHPRSAWLVPFFLLGNEAPHPTQGSQVRDVESQEPEPGLGGLGAGAGGGSLAHLSVLPDRNNRLAEEAAFRESFWRGRSEGDEEEEFLRGLDRAQ